MRLEIGVIELAETEFDALIVCASKKYRSIGICIDSRKMNEVTARSRSSYPLWRINEGIDSLDGISFFYKPDVDCY